MEKRSKKGQIEFDLLKEIIEHIRKQPEGNMYDGDALVEHMEYWQSLCK